MDPSKESLWGTKERKVQNGDIWDMCVNVDSKSDYNNPIGNIRSDHLKSMFKMLNMVLG